MATEKDNGGQAVADLSLRDYFAAQNAAGMCANQKFWAVLKDGKGVEVVRVSADVLARNAYTLADAMLTERAK